MEKITDQVILDFNQGDTYAFDLVFNTYYKSIVIFAEKITGSHTEAEDLVIDVFVKLYERSQQFNTEQHIKAFLYISARNKCLNYLKEQKRYYDLQKEFVLYIQDDTLLEYEYSIKAELVEAVRNAIEELPEECRKIFKLLYYEELKPAEIAEDLQISVSTVYVQKGRAMKALKLKFGYV
jgi:RNA polymerase sigma-70 factor (ECF subfamily)